MSAQSTPGELWPKEVSSWADEQLKMTSAGSEIANSVYDLITAYYQTLHSLDLPLDEALRRAQIQAALFNLGIVASLNSLPIPGAAWTQNLDPLGIWTDAYMKMSDPELAYDKRNVFVTAGIAFVEKFFEELQRIVCSDEEVTRLSRYADVSGKSLGTAIGVYLMHEVGIQEPVAIGLATFILMIVAVAGRNALCRMEKADFIDNLKR